MYKQFCKNYKNYVILNRAGIDKNEYRLKIARSIEGLADVELYKRWKQNNDPRCSEVEGIVYEINKRNDIHSFHAFSWELAGYGFEARRSDTADKEELDEQIKLIELLLGTSYWFDDTKSPSDMAIDKETLSNIDSQKSC